MGDERFRPAQPADISALLGLQAAYYVEDGNPFVETVAREVWTALLSDDRLGRVWVAEAGPSLVGYAVLTLGYSLEHRGRDAFLDELYVAPPARGRGLGRKLMELLETACSELGVQALHLEVERDKAQAQALYRRRGFESHDRFLMTKRITLTTPCAPAAR
jgi:ribosomal protein S18 acetylase RimI-like enzyme